MKTGLRRPAPVGTLLSFVGLPFLTLLATSGRYKHNNPSSRSSPDLCPQLILSGELSGTKCWVMMRKLDRKMKAACRSQFPSVFHVHRMKTSLTSGC